MRIIVITDDFYPNKGGVAHTLMNFYKFSKKNQLNVTIINPFINKNDFLKKLNKRIKNLKILSIECFKAINFNIFIILISRLLFNKDINFVDRIKMIIYLFYRPKLTLNILNNLKKIFYYLKNTEFDFILASHGGWIFILSFLLSNYFNKKLILMAHGDDFLVKSPLTMRTYYFKYTNKIILSNQIMKKLIKKIHHLNENQLQVINRGIVIQKMEIKENRIKLRKLFNIPNDIFVILSVGRHVPRKNFSLVIKAIKKIVETYPNIKIRYYLIGKGKETQNLKDLRKKLNLDKYVFFLGTVDFEKRNKFYKLSDIFVMPSDIKNNSIEGFGIVFLEANYYKLPIIGGDTGGIRAAIIDGLNGFLINPKNINDLVEKILLFYKNEDLRLKMGERGHLRVINNYSWNTIINEFISLFKNLVEN